MRSIDVTIESNEFVAGLDPERQTFTVSFSYSPSPATVYWNDIQNMPTEQNPAPFHETAFNGNYERLNNLPVNISEKDIDDLSEV